MGEDQDNYRILMISRPQHSGLLLHVGFKTIAGDSLELFFSTCWAVGPLRHLRHGTGKYWYWHFIISVETCTADQRNHKTTTYASTHSFDKDRVLFSVQ